MTSRLQYDTNDAGLLDLEYQIRSTPSDELVEQVSLLIESPPGIQRFAWPRLRLAVWEIKRRLTVESQAVA